MRQIRSLIITGAVTIRINDDPCNCFKIPSDRLAVFESLTLVEPISGLFVQTVTIAVFMCLQKMDRDLLLPRVLLNLKIT